MKILAVLLLFLSAFAGAEKMKVKIGDRWTGQNEFTQYVPGIGVGNSASSANCGVYGNTANCSGTGSGSTVYLPPRTIQNSINLYQLVLLLPDGRKAVVRCADHFWGLSNNRHNCKYPQVNDLEADFSGDKVKLKWGVGLDGKKKESETFLIFKVIPAGATAP